MSLTKVTYSMIQGAAANVLDFGADPTGTNDSLNAIQSAIDSNAAVYLPEGTYKTTGTLTIPSNVMLLGTANTTINYTGTGIAVANPNPGSRVYNWVIHDLTISTTTGATAFKLDSVSTSEFKNVLVTGFDYGFHLYSPTSGYSVYNRFYNCRVEGGLINYTMNGTSSNANVFYACRAGGFSQIGFYIHDSNDNTITECQIENNTGVGVELAGSASGLTTGNRIVDTRFEGAMTYGVNLGTNSSSTFLITNGFFSSVLQNVRDDCGGAYQQIDNFTSRLNTDGYFATGSNDVVTGNRTSADGAIFVGQRAGTKVFDVQALNGGILVRSANNEAVLGNGANLNYYWADSAFFPGPDNARTLGNANHRWSVVYAATGTINTSDENTKTNIRPLDFKEKAVALAIKARIKAFKFKDAVEQKSENARIHFGVIAQDVKEAFESEGLDATKYGVFCSDILEDGTERLGVRYDELLAFIVAVAE